MLGTISSLNRAVYAAVVCVSLVSVASADTFGTGPNQFTIDFLPVSGSTNPASGYGIVNNDYRIGTYEISNDQWDKFTASLGVPVTGQPASAYQQNPYFPDPKVPTNMVSWYEAAQFVNWLNTSTDNQPAYRFTGTQGTSDYSLAIWSPAEAENGTNLYRHKDAMYYLPTDDEWVKAAYWNGNDLQTYATKGDVTPHQGDGVSGTGWNYYGVSGYATDPYGPWDVGSGSEELNDTFDMMGNVWEWIESPFYSGDYGTDSYRVRRAGAYNINISALKSNFRPGMQPFGQVDDTGFRVACDIPEPASLSLLALGGVALILRRLRA